jgi:hypothetical protein
MRQGFNNDVKAMKVLPLFMERYSGWDPLESAESDFGAVSEKMSYAVSGVIKPITTINPYNLEWFPEKVYLDRVINFERFTLNLQYKCIFVDRMIIDQTSKVLTADRKLRSAASKSAISLSPPNLGLL